MIVTGSVEMIGSLYDGFCSDDGHELLLIKTRWPDKYESNGTLAQIRFGMQRNKEVWPGDKYYIALLGEDGRYRIEEVTLKEDKKGVKCFDVRNYLKQNGHCVKCAHFEPQRVNLYKRVDWRKQYSSGYGTVAETGFYLSKSHWLDMWLYSLDIYYTANGMLTYEGENVHKIELHWIEKDYGRVSGVTALLQKSFESPHSISRDDVKTIFRKYGSEHDIQYFVTR